MKLWPYNFTAMHSFQQSNSVFRLISVNGIFKQLMTANFILSGTLFQTRLDFTWVDVWMNKINHWSTENPLPIHEVKIYVCCALNIWRIICPVFLTETIADVLRLILQSLFIHLSKFQQNSVTMCTTKHSMQILNRIFGESVCELCSMGTYFSNIALYNFFLWEHLNEKVLLNQSAFIWNWPLYPQNTCNV